MRVNHQPEVLAFPADSIQEISQELEKFEQSGLPSARHLESFHPKASEESPDLVLVIDSFSEPLYTKDA